MRRRISAKTIWIIVLLLGLYPLLGLAAEEAQTFTDYGSGTTIALEVGKRTWQINWGQGPWTWFDAIGDSLLSANVSSILDLQTTAPADINTELLATLPIAGTLTLSAHDPQNLQRPD